MIIFGAKKGFLFRENNFCPTTAIVNVPNIKLADFRKIGSSVPVMPNMSLFTPQPI
jgi:hypothetical protein